MACTLSGREIRFPPDPELAVPHYSFRDLEHYVTKFNRYTSTEALQLNERNFKYDWRFAIHMMMHDLWEHYELNHAKLDGSLGWISPGWPVNIAGCPTRSSSICNLRDAAPSVPRASTNSCLSCNKNWPRSESRRPQLPLGIMLRQTMHQKDAKSSEFVSWANALVDGDRLLRLNRVILKSYPVVRQPIGALVRTLCVRTRPTLRNRDRS